MIDTGDIIHLKGNPVPNRETKWVIVVAKEQKWCFCINTENRLMYNCTELKKKSHPFLKNEKHYIACKDVIEYKEDNVTGKYGSLNKDELLALMSHIINNVKTINQNKKLIILKSLQEKVDEFSL